MVAGAQIRNLYTKPQVETETIGLDLNLEDLQPFLDIFEVPANVAGKLQLEIEPTEIVHLDKQALETLTLSATLGTTNLQAQSGAHQLKALHGEVAFKYVDQNLWVSSPSVQVQFSNPQVNLGNGEFTFEVQTPLADWMTPLATGETRAKMDARLGSLKLEDIIAPKTTIALSVEGPTSILRKQPAKKPLVYEANFHLHQLSQGLTQVQSIRGVNSGSLHDLRGDLAYDNGTLS